MIGAGAPTIGEGGFASWRRSFIEERHLERPRGEGSFQAEVYAGTAEATNCAGGSGRWKDEGGGMKDEG
jgi:hypothetical protein